MHDDFHHIASGDCNHSRNIYFETMEVTEARSPTLHSTLTQNKEYKDLVHFFSFMFVSWLRGLPMNSVS